MSRTIDGKKGGKGYRNNKTPIGGVVHAMFHFGRRIREGNKVVDTFTRGSDFIILPDHKVYKLENMLDTFD